MSALPVESTVTLILQACGECGITLARLPEGQHRLEGVVAANPETVSRTAIDEPTGYRRSSRNTSPTERWQRGAPDYSITRS